MNELEPCPTCKRRPLPRSDREIHQYPCVPMEAWEVHEAASAGGCWECGETTVECYHECAPFCPGCVGYSETRDCYWCRKPLLDPEMFPPSNAEKEAQPNEQ